MATATATTAMSRHRAISKSRIAHPLLLIIVLFALCFGVLTYGAHRRFLREDEAIAFEGTAGNLITTVQYQMADVHAPFYFVSFYLWQQFLGDGEFPSRMYSVLLSMITLALIYRLGRRWLGSNWAGLAAIVGLGLSAYFFVYAIEIRPYALVMLTAALSMLFFSLWTESEEAENRRWRYALLWAVTVIMMLYLHYLGTFLFLLQGVYLLLRGPKTWAALWKQAVGAVLLVVVIWGPWFPIFWEQVHRIGGFVKNGDTHIAGLGVAATPIPTTPNSIYALTVLMTNEQPLLFGVVLLAGLVLLWRKRLYWLAVAWGIGVPAAMLTVNLIVPLYEPRYASTLVPGFGLLVGLSLAALPERFKIKTLALSVFGVLALLTVETGAVLRVPLRDYLKQFDAAFQPGDTVLLDTVPFDNTAQYQYKHYAPSVMSSLITSQPVQPVPSPLVKEISADAPLPRCVWFVTSGWADQAVRNRFIAITATHPLLQVIGDERYLFQRLCAPPSAAPSAEPPHLFGDAMRFLGADVEQASTSQIVLRLWWDVAKPPTADYSMSLQVLNADGTLAAQSDGPILDYWGKGNLQTSTLKPGYVYIDHRTVALPLGTAAGDYSLGLTVYQPWDGTRLAVEGGQNNLLTVKKVTIAAAAK